MKVKSRYWVKCAVCGAEVEKSSNNQRTCSERCREKFRKVKGTVKRQDKRKISRELIDELKRQFG